MTERSSIFDMIGPVMIGPSSSHTAGVVRIGRAGRHLLDEPVQQATITFYNSFATTYEGHGSDRAILAGLLDCTPDDERVREGVELAQQSGMQYAFKTQGSNSKLHPNSIRMQLSGASGRSVEALGISRGGGLVSIAEVDGYHANFTTQLPTLIIKADDTVGSIAFLSSICAHDRSNIATMTVGRRGRANEACLIMEIDSPISDIALQYMRNLWWVHQVTALPPLS